MIEGRVIGYKRAVGRLENKGKRERGWLRIERDVRDLRI